MAQKDKNEELKSLITSLLNSTPLKCTVRKLNEDFKNFMGYEIPYTEMGFHSLIGYLNSIPDTVNVFGNGAEAIAELVVKEKSAHIRKLVSKQKIKRKGKSCRPLPTPVKPPRFANNYTSNWVQKQSDYFTRNQLGDASTSSTNTTSTPSFNSKRSSSTNNIKSDTSSSRSDSSCSSINIDHNVPVQIQRNFKELISKFPNGLSCLKLSSEYKKLFKHEIKYDKYGYRSLIEMCLDLSEILVCTQPTLEDFILYDASQPIPEIGNDSFEKTELLVPVEENSHECTETVELVDVTEMNWSLNVSIVPPDVLTIADKVRRYFDFEKIKPKDAIVVKVGEIYDPSKFWIYIKADQLDGLMHDIQSFFIGNRNKYLVPQCLLAEGLYCIGVYLNEFNRAVIIDMLPCRPGFVKLLFIDYGTTSVVNSKEIYYLPKVFAKLPYQSIRAKLADIMPCVQGDPWPLATLDRFRDLAKGDLVANIMKIDKDDYVLDVFLFDAVNDTLYIQDVLVKEGLAIYIDEEPKKMFDDPNITSHVKYLHLYPYFDEIEQGLAPTIDEINHIYDNKIPIEFYLRPYFQINIDEDIASIQEKHEMVLSTFDNISFDNVIIENSKLHLITNDNSNMNEKTLSNLNEEHQIMKEESLNETITGSCNRNRIKKLMNFDEDHSNKSIVENESSELNKQQLNCNAKEFTPNTSKRVCLNYSNNLVINKNEMKNSNILEKFIGPNPFDKTLIKSTNSSSFRGFVTPLFQPFNVEKTPIESSGIYYNYRKNYEGFRNVCFKSIFEEDSMLQLMFTKN